MDFIQRRNRDLRTAVEAEADGPPLQRRRGQGIGAVNEKRIPNIGAWGLRGFVGICNRVGVVLPIGRSPGAGLAYILVGIRLRIAGDGVVFGDIRPRAGGDEEGKGERKYMREPGDWVKPGNSAGQPVLFHTTHLRSLVFIGAARELDTSSDAPDEACRNTLKDTSEEAKLHCGSALSMRLSGCSLLHFHPTRSHTRSTPLCAACTRGNSSRRFENHCPPISR